MQRGSSVGLTVLLVLAAMTGGLAGSVLAQEESPAGTPTPDGATNETVQHVDPDETNENGDLGGLQSVLASRMADRLGGSSIQLTEGQYDIARQLVGEEYRDQYGKYVDVAGETQEEGGSEAFDRARDRQQEFVDAVESYNETREEYQEAKRNGNEQRARELARDLEQTAGNVSETAERLNRSYGNISGQTGVNLSRASEAVQTVSETISTEQAEVREAEFDSTSLTVNPQSETASFASPQVIDGQLTTENGSALANRTVVIRVAERRETVETNATGTFTLEYRPVTTQAGPATVRVRFVPNETSVYLGAQANASFVVEQVDSTVDVERLTPQATFGTPVEVAGRVRAADRSVPGVPVVMSVDGTSIARGTTTADGSFTLTASLPANVPVGEQPVTVRVALEARAIAGSETTRTLSVTETATNLTLDTETSGSTITLAGELVTEEDEEVPGQQLEIRRNGSLVATTQTGPGGEYEATLDGEAGERYRVAVRYADPTTNLEGVSRSSVVAVPSASGPGVEPADLGFLAQLERWLNEQLLGGPGGGVGAGLANALGAWLSAPLVVLGTSLGFALMFGVGWFAVRRTRGGEASDEESTTSLDNSEMPTPDLGATERLNPLGSARSTVDENTDAAVELAYVAARNRIQDGAVASADATHWEFYRACVAAGLEDPEALETLTSLYERAAFGRTDVSRDEAETALARAARFV